MMKDLKRIVVTLADGRKAATWVRREASEVEVQMEIDRLASLPPQPPVVAQPEELPEFFSMHRKVRVVSSAGTYEIGHRPPRRR